MSKSVNSYIPRQQLDATDRKIIKAAIGLLAEKGYDSTSIGAISARLKISKGVVHYHFSSKEILFQETVSYVYQQAKQYMEGQVWRTDDAWQQLETFITLSCQYYVEHGRLIKALQEIRANFRPVQTRSLASTLFEKELADLQTVIAAGQTSGLLLQTFDPTIAAMTLRMALNGAAGQIIEADNPKAMGEKYAADLKEMFWRAWRR